MGRHVARKFDNILSKQILEGSLGGRSSAGTARNRWEDRMWKLVAQYKKNGVQQQDVGVIGRRKQGRPWPGNGLKSYRKKKKKTT